MVYEVFMNYIAMAERQTNQKLISFTLDRGGEFINSLLGPELDKLGIILHTTAGHAPQQNGVAERGNRTITTKARAMMVESGVPISFWYQAFSTAVFLTNRTITTAVSADRTPFEIWHFRKPSISHLRVFGCKAYRLIRKELRSSKFEPVSSEGILVGFDQDNFNYQIFDLTSQKIIMSHDVTFDESQFPYSTSTPNQNHNDPAAVKLEFTLEDDSDDDLEGVTPLRVEVTEDVPCTPIPSSTEPNPHVRDTTINSDLLQVPVLPRVSSRNSNKRISYKGMCAMVDDQAHEPVFDCLPSVFSAQALPSADPTPKSLKSALNMYDGEKWLAACKKEVNSLSNKNVWTLVD